MALTVALKPTTHRTEANRRESRRAYERHHRLSTTERGYGWDYQQWRDRIIRERPLCEDCLDQGRVTPAEELHHMVKIKDDPSRRLDEDNARMLCGPCHDKRTARGE